MDQYEFEKYVTNKEALKSTLKKYGVAIIPAVLNNSECENMVGGLWDYFEHISQSWPVPISRDKVFSYRQIYKLYPLHSMLFQHFNIGHTQASWNVRQNPKIVDIFQHFWNEKELLVSFDGLSFNMPPEKTNRGWYRGNTWYHTDQSYTRPDFECVQSWATGLDVNKGDATLAFMEKSHIYHEEFSKTFGIKDNKDWTKLTKEQEKFYTEKGCEYKKIYCPKGSIVFWDSRTIHCGCEALKERPNSNMRAIVYLCYTPKNLITPALLRKKQKAFNELRTTNHWPHKPKLFGKSPRTYGGEIPLITPISKPLVTELGMSLAGFDEKPKIKNLKITSYLKFTSK